nr:MAG TPA: hypothetical protein [Caudoviricetes sp.]
MLEEVFIDSTVLSNTLLLLTIYLRAEDLGKHPLVTISFSTNVASISRLRLITRPC